MDDVMKQKEENIQQLKGIIEEITKTMAAMQLVLDDYKRAVDILMGGKK